MKDEDRNTVKIVACPKCQGVGYIKLEPCYMLPSDDYKYIKCDKCDGLGRMKETRTVIYKYEKLENLRTKFDTLSKEEIENYTISYMSELH